MHFSEPARLPLRGDLVVFQAEGVVRGAICATLREEPAHLPLRGNLVVVLAAGVV